MDLLSIRRCLHDNDTGEGLNEPQKALVFNIFHLLHIEKFITREQALAEHRPGPQLRYGFDGGCSGQRFGRHRLNEFESSLNLGVAWCAADRSAVCNRHPIGITDGLSQQCAGEFISRFHDQIGVHQQ